MDVGRAFGLPFKDSKWFGKVVVAAIVGLIPLINFALVGWGIEYIDRVARGYDTLPEWSDFGKHWVRGLGFALASVVYYSPALLILIFGGVFSGSIIRFASSPEAAITSALGSLGLTFFVALIFLLAAGFLLQAARTNYALTGRMSAVFDFRAILSRVGSNFGSYFAAWFLSILVVAGAILMGGFIGAFLGVIPILGWIIEIMLLPVFAAAGVLAGSIGNALFGEYARVAYPDIVGGPPSSPGATPPAFSPPAYPGGDTIPPTVMAPVADLAPAGASGAATPSTFDGDAGRAAIAAVLSRRSGTQADATVPLPTAGATPKTVIAVPIAVAGPEATVEPAAAAEPEPDPEVMPAPEPEAVGPEPIAEFEPEPLTDSQPTVEFEPLLPAEPEPVSEFAAEPRPEPEPQPELEPEAELAAEAEPALELAPQPESPATPAPIPQPAPVAAPISGAPPAPAPAASQPRRFEIVKEAGPGSPGQAWTLPSADVRIGRGEACFVMIPDGKASRVHAVLSAIAGSLTITDQGSSNGTFVNEVQLGLDARELAPGDRVRIGDTILAVRELG